MARPNFIAVNLPVIIKTPGREVRTIIQDTREDGFAVLAPAGEELVLLPGEEILMVCNRQDARYEFKSTVQRFTPADPPLYYLAYPAEYRRIQARSHVRAKAALEVRYAPWPAEDWPHRPPRPCSRGVTVDISGGGAQLVLREPMVPGDLLYLEICLPGSRRNPMHLAGRVKRVVPREIDGERRYEVGVAFEALSERQEDEIVAFVFRRLLEERQRGGWEHGS